VGLGRLRVIVPRGLDVTVHGGAGAGNVTLFGDDRASRRVDRQVTDPGVASTGSITLDLRVGVGHVEVDRA
jgi:predicted membrane protein